MENKLFTAPELGEFFWDLSFFKEKTKNSASFFSGTWLFFGEKTKNSASFFPGTCLFLGGNNEKMQSLFSGTCLFFWGGGTMEKCKVFFFNTH